MFTCELEQDNQHAKGIGEPTEIFNPHKELQEITGFWKYPQQSTIQASLQP